MSNPAVTPHDGLALDPGTGLLMRISDQLIPLFASPEIDAPLARQIAIRAIGSYQPENHADFVNVARAIAFSMAALALLGKAAGQDIPMAEKMRTYSRANALNRSADQSERTMMQRRRHQRANPPAEQAEWMEPNPRFTPSHEDFDHAAAEAAIDAAVTEALNAYRTQPAAPPAKPAPVEPAFAPSGPTSGPSSTKPATPQPSLDPKQPSAAIPVIANRVPAAGPAYAEQPAASFPAASFKKGLMQHSAMQRPIVAGGTPQKSPHPG